MKKAAPNAQWIALAILASAAIAFLGIALAFQGTYDAGDSVMHYLFSRYAPQHPHLLLDHWGKPFFTLLAMPFAQGGIVGMKIFQIIIALLTGWMLFSIARKMRYSAAWLILIFLFFAPKYFLGIFSGFTEPLFGLICTAGVFFMLHEKEKLAAVMISFLPFVRTEGYIVLVLYIVFLLLTYRARILPWLLLGSVLYGLAGLIFYGDFFWQFSQNPYHTGVVDNYGSGSWDHFFVQMLYILGIPLYALLGLGVIRQVVALFRPAVRPAGPYQTERIWLLYGVFMGYFLAHVYFWTNPDIRSLGMPRVMIAIVPMAAFIALDGLDFVRALLARWNARASMIWVGLALAITLLFPFSGNPAGLRLPRDLQPDAGTQLAYEAAAYCQAEGLLDNPIFTDHPGAILAFEIDPFDSTKMGSLRKLSEGKLPPGSILIWDNWFANMEAGVHASFFELPNIQSQYALLKSFHGPKGQTEVRIYRTLMVD